mgnify:CR=1 FL=1
MGAKPATIVRHSLKLREGISITVAKELEKAAKEFAGEIANAAKSELASNDTERTGLLKAAVSSKAVSYKKRKFKDGKLAINAAIWGGVGINKAVVGNIGGKPIKPSKYAHLVEFGHKAPDGSYVPPKPFMRPAIAKVGSGTEFVRRLEAAFLKGVEAAKERAAKK